MNIALIFGYGQGADGSIDKQTMDRCQRAIELCRKGKIDRPCITVSAEKNGVAMAGAMKAYLVNQGIPGDNIFVDKRGGNTAGEMDVFLQEITVGKKDKIIFISTWYHIPRIIWLAWWRLPCRRFSVAIAWRYAWADSHWKSDVLKEFLKLANAILRPRKSSKIAVPK